MTTKIHAGWGQSMGRPFCGTRKVNFRFVLEESRVTCLGCLRHMVASAHRDAVNAEKTLKGCIGQYNRYRQYLDYARKQGVDTDP